MNMQPAGNPIHFDQIHTPVTARGFGVDAKVKVQTGCTREHHLKTRLTMLHSMGHHSLRHVKPVANHARSLQHVQTTYTQQPCEERQASDSGSTFLPACVTCPSP